MGNENSVEIKIPENFEHFSILFCKKNKLRLLLAPQEIIEITKNVLQTIWNVRKIVEKTGYVEFHLGRRPFNGYEIDNVNFKYLLCLLFKQYYSIGWHFKTSISLSRRNTSSNLIFEKKNPLTTYVMSVSLYGTDKLRIFGPNDVVNYIKTVLVTNWKYGIQRERMIGNGWEFKLKNAPWSTFSNDKKQNLIGATLITSIMKTLYHHGWISMGSCKTGMRRDDLNVLYFRFDQTLKNELNFISNQVPFIALTLNKENRIRLINAPHELANILRNAIVKNWSNGIAHERLYNGAYEFELRGVPWISTGFNSINAKRIIASILCYFKQQHWNLYATCVLSMNLTAKSVFIFRFDNTNKTKETNIKCISLSGYDKIRVINGNDLHILAVSDAIRKIWPKGIKNNNYYGNSWQFSLKGKPFVGYKNYNIFLTILVMVIISNLKSENVNFLCSAFVKGANLAFDDDSLYDNYNTTLSSLFFV